MRRSGSYVTKIKSSIINKIAQMGGCNAPEFSSNLNSLEEHHL